MGSDLLTALALVLIIEGLLPGLAPSTWMKVMQDAAKMGALFSFFVAPVTLIVAKALGAGKFRRKSA